MAPKFENKSPSPIMAAMMHSSQAQAQQTQNGYLTPTGHKFPDFVGGSVTEGPDGIVSNGDAVVLGLNNSGSVNSVKDGQPSSVELSPGEGDDSSLSNHLTSECMDLEGSDDEDEEDDNGHPVIFPWMKKLHIAGKSGRGIQLFP